MRPQSASRTSSCFLFIHVMKTAGTTFAWDIRRQWSASEIYPSREVEPIGPDPYQHMSHVAALSPERRATIRVFTGHFPFMLRDLLGTNVVTMTLLRDPITRTISALKHFKRLDRYRDLSLESIYDDRQIFRPWIENHQTKVFALRPDDNKDSIGCGLTIDDARFDHALQNLSQVDVLGLTESYSDFFDEIRSRFGWWRGGRPAGVPKNVSDETWDADRRLRQRISTDNAYDMELYRRAAELVAHRYAHR